jgi:hypothetical protein
MSSFVGSPLSGPTAEPAPTVLAVDATQIDVDWIALQKLPNDGLTPLDTQSRLTIAPLASTPVLTTGRITRLVRFAAEGPARSFSDRLQSGDLGPAIQVTRQSGFLVPGSTLRFQSTASNTAGESIRQITLSISQTPSLNSDALATRPTRGTFAIGVEGVIREAVAADAEDAAHSRNSSAPTTGRETALLDDLSLADGAHFVVLAPCKFAGTTWTALVAEIDVHRVTNDAAGLAALGKLHSELADASKRAASLISPPGEQPTLQSAIGSLRRSGDLRPPLLFLATATRAPIAADFALVADDAFLGRLRDETIRYASSKAQPLTPENLEWFLDRTTLLLMADQARKGALSLELASVLTLHTGQVGRDPDSIEEVVKSVGNRHDLEVRLISENYIELEDNFPGARVRAFDWLKTQGKAPAGFDPLGDAKGRRAAIENALEPSGGTP